jgi:ribulose-5-phosphate 4-epimerase/fuculose-1-phosphate aldolase
MTDETGARAAIVEAGRHLDRLGLAPGRSGNLSVRLSERVVLTGTNQRLGKLDAEALPVVDLDGTVLTGPNPTKEAALHLGMYRARPDAAAIVHLHSPYAAAASCLADLDPADAFPPVTAYYLMQVGRMPLVPFHPPGSPDLAVAVETLAADVRAMLLANHGLLAADASLDAAVVMAEEIESTARLVLLLRGAPVSLVPDEWVERLRRQG